MSEALVKLAIDEISPSGHFDELVLLERSEESSIVHSQNSPAKVAFQLPPPWLVAHVALVAGNVHLLDAIDFAPNIEACSSQLKGKQSLQVLV